MSDEREIHVDVTTPRVVRVRSTGAVFTISDTLSIGCGVWIGIMAVIVTLAVLLPIMGGVLQLLPNLRRNPSPPERVGGLLFLDHAQPSKLNVARSSRVARFRPGPPVVRFGAAGRTETGPRISAKTGAARGLSTPDRSGASKGCCPGRTSHPSQTRAGAATGPKGRAAVWQAGANHVRPLTKADERAQGLIGGGPITTFVPAG